MIEKGCVYIADGPSGGAIGAVAILPPSPWADAEKGLSFVAGTDDAAIVSLLTGLRRFGPKPGDQSSADGHPRAIERVYEPVALPLFGPEAGLHASGLKVTAHGTGGNFPEAPLPIILPGQPDLNIVGHTRAEPHVTCAENNCPVRKLELFQDFLGTVCHAL